LNFRQWQSDKLDTARRLIEIILGAALRLAHLKSLKTNENHDL
jgi:hypothetical protein